MSKILASVLVALLALGACAQAATVTNSLGQVVTVGLLSETADAGTVAQADQSVPATFSDRRGIIVAQCKITGSTTSADFGNTVPKGAITIASGGVVEVETAVTPATATNAIAIGGITALAAGTTLQTTGVKAIGALGITTSADKPTITFTGSAATQGVFTIYLPYVLGNASR